MSDTTFKHTETECLSKILSMHLTFRDRWILSIHSKMVHMPTISITWQTQDSMMVVMEGTLRTDLGEDGEAVFELSVQLTSHFIFKKNLLSIRNWKTPSPSSPSSPPWKHTETVCLIAPNPKVSVKRNPLQTLSSLSMGNFHLHLSNGGLQISPPSFVAGVKPRNVSNCHCVLITS